MTDDTIEHNGKTLERLLDIKQIAAEIKNAFHEGYNSYATNSSAYNTAESAWNDSEAKQTHDRLLAKVMKT
jgi:hypothetical protein